jgi:hypothetical protein
MLEPRPTVCLADTLFVIQATMRIINSRSDKAVPQALADLKERCPHIWASCAAEIGRRLAVTRTVRRRDRAILLARWIEQTALGEPDDEASMQSFWLGTRTLVMALAHRQKATSARIAAERLDDYKNETSSPLRNLFSMRQALLRQFLPKPKA